MLLRFLVAESLCVLQKQEDSTLKRYGAMTLLGVLSQHIVGIPWRQRPVELHSAIYEFFRYKWRLQTDFPKPAG